MLKNKFNITEVIGLKSSDNVIVVGNAAFMPWLTDYFKHHPNNIVSAKKPNDLAKLIRDGHQFHFDKMIISRETAFNQAYLAYAAEFKSQIVYFPQDDGWQFEQSVEFYYPGELVYQFDSDFGYVMLFTPSGTSWRIIHG